MCYPYADVIRRFKDPCYSRFKGLVLSPHADVIRSLVLSPHADVIRSYVIPTCRCDYEVLRYCVIPTCRCDCEV